MASGYNPFQYTQSLSQFGGQTGGAGALWEGLQKGTSREEIRKYIERQASKASDASSKLGQSGMWAKLAGIASMAIPGIREASMLTQFLTGAAASGATSKFLGDRAVSGLSKEDAPDVLYNVDTAREAETTAHSAVDKLISSVNPLAVTSAVTTPLSVLTMKNYKMPMENRIVNSLKKSAEERGLVDSSNLAYQNIVNRLTPGESSFTDSMSQLKNLLQMLTSNRKY